MSASGCRVCKWLDVPPDKAGRITVRNGYSYKCTAPVPPLTAIPLPESVMSYFSFHWPPPRAYMSAGAGKECPTYERRTK